MRRILLTMLLILAAAVVCASELKTGEFYFGKGKKAHLILPENFKPGRHNKFLLFLPGRGAVAGSAAAFGSADFALLRKLFSEKGYVIAVPSLESSWFNCKMEQEVDEMLDFLAEKLQLDLSRFHIMGGSMGGMSALVYTGRNFERVKAVFTMFPVSEMAEFSKGNYKESIKAAYGGYYADKKALYESRSPMNYVPLLTKIPLFIIHGDADWHISVEYSKVFYNTIRKLGGNQVKLTIVPKMTHHNKIVKGYEKEIVDFFEKYN